MTRYKPIDFFLQLIITLVILAGATFSSNETLSPINYFMLLGLVQLISLLIHFATGPQPWKQYKLRKIHGIGTLIVIVLVIFAFLQDSFASNSGDRDDKYAMPGLATLIYTMIPVILLMLFYIAISWIEWRTMKKLKNEGR
jgi:hypothetical protein